MIEGIGTPNERITIHLALDKTIEILVYSQYLLFAVLLRDLESAFRNQLSSSWMAIVIQGRAPSDLCSLMQIFRGKSLNRFIHPLVLLISPKK
jgi:hypothetical protein